jgi:hypothetical protein
MDSLPSSIGAGFTSALHFAHGEHDINQCLKLGKVRGGKVTPYKDWACDTKSFDK